jgi:hypothetical protein
VLRGPAQRPGLRLWVGARAVPRELPGVPPAGSAGMDFCRAVGAPHTMQSGVSLGVSAAHSGHFIWAPFPGICGVCHRMLDSHRASQQTERTACRPPVPMPCPNPRAPANTPHLGAVQRDQCGAGMVTRRSRCWLAAACLTREVSGCRVLHRLCESSRTSRPLRHPAYLS